MLKIKEEIEHWKAGMKIVERDKNNHIERLEKELNNLKEIEKSHKEENGKLRVELEQEKEKNKTKVDIKDIEFSNFIKERYVSKDKIKELLENEIIDISGFRCIAVEDIEKLLEDINGLQKSNSIK